MSWQLLAELHLHTEEHSFNVTCYCTRAFTCSSPSEYDEIGVPVTESESHNVPEHTAIEGPDDLDTSSYKNNETSDDLLFCHGSDTRKGATTDFIKDVIKSYDNDSSNRNDICGLQLSSEDSILVRDTSFTTSRSNEFTENSNDNISTMETYSTHELDFSTNIITSSNTSQCSFQNGESGLVADATSSLNTNKDEAGHTDTETGTGSFEDFVLIHQKSLEEGLAEIKISDIESTSSEEQAATTESSSTRFTDTSDYASENETSSEKSKAEHQTSSSSAESTCSSDSFYSLDSSNISFSSVFSDSEFSNEHAEDYVEEAEYSNGYNWFDNFTIDTINNSNSAQGRDVSNTPEILLNQKRNENILTYCTDSEKNRDRLYIDTSSSSDDKELLHKYYSHGYCSEQVPSIRPYSSTTTKTEYQNDNDIPDCYESEFQRDSSWDTIPSENINGNQHDQKEECEDTNAVSDLEAELMKAMGLPLAFGKQSSSYARKSSSKNHQKKQKAQSFQSSCQQVQAAFDLMKIHFNSPTPALGGKVHYKMKRIADQNYKLHFGTFKRTHTYFDEDGAISQSYEEDAYSEEYQLQEEESCGPLDNYICNSESRRVLGQDDADDTSSDKEVIKKSRKRHTLKKRSKTKQHIFFDDDANPIPCIDETENSESHQECQRKRNYSLGIDAQEDSISCKTRKVDVELELHDQEDVPKKDVEINEELTKEHKEATEDITREVSTEACSVTEKQSECKLVSVQTIQNNPALRKYWYMRFALFSKFNEGIQLDEESWYSVTPEKIAKYTAERCKCSIIVDGFCGAGGNAIQFAFTCDKVIAIDIDPNKIELAKNNARVYGVEDKIEFVVGDFFQLAPTLTADVVFLSPPWGGPSYLKASYWYDLYTQLQPKPIDVLIETARNISKNIAIFLPRNSDVVPLLQAVPGGERIEIQQNVDRKKVVAITAFYNDLIIKCD